MLLSAPLTPLLLSVVEVVEVVVVVEAICSSCHGIATSHTMTSIMKKKEKIEKKLLKISLNS